MTNLQEVSVEGAVVRLRGGTRLKGAVAEGSKDLPLVTVITAVLNMRLYIAGCLESVLQQDYPNIEHIVIDGGSSDGTVDVLREYDDRIGLWTSKPDRGLYDAWNIALPDARGEWICFIGADDELLPGAVSAYMALAAKNPEAEYLSSFVRMVHHSGYERFFGRPWKWKEFSRWMSVAHPEACTGAVCSNAWESSTSHSAAWMTMSICCELVTDSKLRTCLWRRRSFGWAVVPTNSMLSQTLPARRYSSADGMRCWRRWSFG